MRDEFPSSTKSYLSRMAAFRCSNPECRRPTIGSASTGESAINVGVAAHITAASPGGKRYDELLSSKARRHHTNGIWLCQTCAKLVDSDPARYTAIVLHQWRAAAQKAAHFEVSTGAFIEPTAWRSVSLTTPRFHSSEMDGYQPPLDLRLRDSDGNRLFFFAAKDRIPFCGRTNELDRLRSWLAGDVGFSWSLVTGHGGAGKSRLALELCLGAIEEGWSAGFISRSSAMTVPSQFAHFRPRVPTLIVFDYVADTPERAGELVRTLADLAISGRLSLPVRLLMLEREEAAIWWTRFTGGEEQQMNAYRGLGQRELRLTPLGDEVQWQILQHVAGPIAEEHREDILTDLKRIDPRGRPLLVALAARSMKQGRQLRQLDAQGILNDIVARERKRWQRAAYNADELYRHENALALATMTGGIDLRRMVPSVANRHFPFSEGAYNANLIEVMNDGTGSRDQILPVEPDIVGEWIVLDFLRPQNAFDVRPAALRSAAEEVAAHSVAANSFWMSFKIRTAQDNPEAALEVDLFRAPPVVTPPEEVAGWLLGLSDAIEHFLVRPEEARALFDSVVEFRSRYPKNHTLQTAAARVYFHYARAVAKQDFDGGFSILDQLFDWARKLPDITELAVRASQLGEWIGHDRLRIGDIESTTYLFETLREAAKQFEEMRHSEWEEIADAAASLGLSMRQFYADNSIEDAVQDLNVTLWSKPVDTDALDLAERTGQVLMQRGDGDLCTKDDAYQELKRRSCARPEAQAIALWAANAGYCVARDADDKRKFVEALIDLAAWIKPRANWPDMEDVTDDAVSNEWLTYDFGLGRAPIEALFDLLAEAAEKLGSRSGSSNLGNEYPYLRAELLSALETCEDKEWAMTLRVQISELDSEPSDPPCE